MRNEDRLLQHLLDLPCAAQGSHLYRYDQGRWKASDIRDGYRVVNDWMVVNSPRICGTSHGFSMIRQVIDRLSDVQLLPSHAPAGPVLIPFKSATLELHKDGRILVRDPKPGDGLTYVLTVDLDLSRVNEQNHFVPRTVNPESTWNTFLTTFAPTQALQDRFAEGYGSTLTHRGWGKVLYVHGRTGTAKTTITKIVAGLHEGGCPTVMLHHGERLLKPELVGWYYNHSMLRFYERTLIKDRRGLEAWVQRETLEGRHKCARRSDFAFRPAATIVMDEDESSTAPVDPLLFTLPLTHSFLKDDKLDFHNVILRDPGSCWEVLDWLIAGASRVVQRGYL